MNIESDQLSEMILGVRQAYQRGENAMEFARKTFGQASNSPAITLMAYDLQAGNYIQAAKANPEYRAQWCGQLASLIDLQMDSGDTVLEVGCGEATTLAGVINSLSKRPSAAYGFDISWSRCAQGLNWLAEKQVDATLFVGDLFNIPLGDSSIDVVYTSHSLEPNGGREVQAIQELLRVARKAVVLIEPAYEFASPEARARMESHGYVRGLRDVATGLGVQVVDHRLLPVYGNPLNPSAVLTLLKADAKANKSKGVDWRCPVTKTSLVPHQEGYFSRQSGLLYPCVQRIPLLRSEHAVVASTFEKILDSTS